MNKRKKKKGKKRYLYGRVLTGLFTAMAPSITSYVRVVFASSSFVSKKCAGKYVGAAEVARHTSATREFFNAFFFACVFKINLYNMILNKFVKI